MKKLLLVGLLAIAPASYGQDLDPGVYAHFETNQGDFSIELFEERAPRTVGNFILLATGGQSWRHPETGEVHEDTPFYDGLIFHRIIDGFMIQGGDPSGTGLGGPGYTFEDEFHAGLRHSREGMVSMANSGPDTNGSQLFITLAPVRNLDDVHSIFGEVVAGMDIVRRIGRVATGANDRPFADVTIEKVTVQRVVN